MKATIKVTIFFFNEECETIEEKVIEVPVTEQLLSGTVATISKVIINGVETLTDNWNK